MVAHLTLARAILEAASTVRYLVDPTVDADQRRRRALGLQLVDYQWRAEFESKAEAARRAAGLPPVERHGGESAVTRRSELKKAMRRLHVTPIMSSLTSRVESYAVVGPSGVLSGGAFYGLLSAFAHAMDRSLWRAIWVRCSQRRGFRTRIEHA